MKPNQAMKDAAQRGLDLRREYGRGGTEVGIARARDIVNGRNLSPETIKRMKAFFDRHEQNRNTSEKETDGGPKNGWIAWLLWGGDAGRSWANARLREMTEFYDHGPINLSEDDSIEREIFRWGPVEHPAGNFIVDDAFARAMLESFTAMAAYDYLPPVLFEHTSEGTIKGLVRGLRITDDGINAVMELASGVKDLADKGELHYLSPSFYATFKHPHTGAKLKFALREVSFVSVPHLKNLRVESAHYSLEENLMEENEVEEGKIPAWFAAFESRLAACEEHIKTLAEKPEEEPEELMEDEKPAENSEVTRMGVLLKKVEKENKLLLRQLAEREIQVELGQVDADTISELVQLREASPALFGKALARMKPATQEPKNLGERGVVGSASGPVSYERAVEMGVSKGIKNGSVDMVEYLATNHPHVMV